MMSKRIVIAIGLLLGSSLQTSGMEVDVPQTSDRKQIPNESESQGCFSLLWDSLFAPEEETASLFPQENNIQFNTSPDPLYNLGITYLEGATVPEDHEKAFDYLKQSADKGNADAQNYVGHLYEKGMGIQADLYKAGLYYKKAADQGHAIAQNNMGSLYESGKGVGQDFFKAEHYYTLSANQDNITAQLNRAHLYESGRIPGHDIGEAINCYEKLATLGNSRAQYHLGLLYKNGKGVEKNLKIAIEYFQFAADQENKRAITELQGLFQNRGTNIQSIDSSIEKALEYLKMLRQEQDLDKTNLALATLLSAAATNAKAQYNLGQIYEYGWGVDEKHKKAIDYYALSAYQGHVEALNSLLKLNIKLGIKIRMDLAHKGNLAHIDYFKKIFKKYEDPKKEKEQQDPRKRIDFFLSELTNIESVYVGLSSWSEGNFSGATSTDQSYKDLFSVVKNDPLRTLYLEVSNFFKNIMKATALLHETGTCITCLDFGDPSLKAMQKTSFSAKKKDTGYLCFTDFSTDLMRTSSPKKENSLEKTLTEISNLFRKSYGAIQNVEKPDQFLDIVNRLKTPKPKLHAFLSCYTQYFPEKDEKDPQKQTRFIEDLRVFFEDNYTKTEAHLTYVRTIEHRFITLTEETTSYRNDLFLQYVGVDVE